MRDLFPEFNTPSSKELDNLWKSATFVFDTNVLLQLWEITQPDVIPVLKDLSNDNRVWLPHQVALEFYAEFHKSKNNFIIDSEESYKNVIKNLDTNQAEVLKRPYSTEVQKKIKRSFDTIKKEVAKTKTLSNWPGGDIEKELNLIFKNRIGPKFQQDKLKAIYKEGEERYAQKIPPGYEDNDKTGISKFGDLVIWHQIIEMAANNKNNEPIILITNEKKEDWWWKHSTGRIIGPRPELRREMKAEAGVEFYMYRLGKFMELANKYLKAKFDEDSIEQAKSSSEQPEISLWGDPNLRNRNLNYSGYPFAQLVNAVWAKAAPAHGYPPYYRRDVCGAFIGYSDYGRGGAFGWEIDHIIPVSRGGTDALSNLRPLHWQNNDAKGDNIDGQWSCRVPLSTSQ